MHPYDASLEEGYEKWKKRKNGRFDYLFYPSTLTNTKNNPDASGIKRT